MATAGLCPAATRWPVLAASVAILAPAATGAGHAVAAVAGTGPRAQRPAVRPRMSAGPTAMVVNATMSAVIAATAPATDQAGPGAPPTCVDRSSPAADA